MKKKYRILFGIITALIVILRFFFLTSIPEGFDQTEASFGYNAYSVLHTGKDEYGKLFPLIVTSFGDYKLSGYMYWQIPFIAVFGLSEFSTRLSTVTAGVLSLLLIADIIYLLFHNRKLALISFFFAGISPWHLILSRMAYDPMIAFFFYLASVSLFLRAYKRTSLWFLFGSALCLSLAIMTYYAVWVIFPFTVACYWLFLYKKIGKRRGLLPVTAILLLPFCMAALLFFLTHGERLYQDSTYQVQATPLLQEQIMEDQQHFPLLMTRGFHNKLLFYPQILLQNLSNNLSFDFLFLRGDKMDRRFYVPYQGVLFLVTAPFLLLGALSFWKRYAAWKNLLILGAIGLVFLGSSFSEFGSETERTLFTVPLFCLFIGYGCLTAAAAVAPWRSSALIAGVGSAMLALNMMAFHHQYYWHANVHQPWGRDYGVRQMVESVRSKEHQYRQVVVPDSSYVFFYFYNQVDPKIAWAEAASRLEKANFVGLRLRAKVGSYLTMPIECPAAGKLKVLYVCRGTKIPLNSHIVEVISYRDGQPAFILLEFLSTPSETALPSNVAFMQKYGVINDGDTSYWKQESELP